MRPGGHRARFLGVLAAVLVFAAACEFAPAAPEPLPTGGRPSATATVAPGGPSVSMDQQWQILDDVWTFTGYVDPRGSETSVTIQIGDDITTPTAFIDEQPVAERLTESGPISVELRTPDTEWLCVRFRAVNAGGEGFTRAQCFPTDLPGTSGNPFPTPPASPGGSDEPAASGQPTASG